VTTAAPALPAPEVPEADDLHVFLELGFYEILGVDPGASTREIRAAFRRLALVHHPDKGGHPLRFAFLRAVHDVLTDPDKRKVCDSRGRAAFEGDLPKPNAPPADVPAGSQCEVREELINIRFARQLQEMLALRHMDICGVPFAVVLEYFVRRAVDVGGGICKITVVWRENTRAAALGLKGRRTSGAAGLEIPPVELVHEEVPSQWSGLSAFGLPRVLCHGLRCGFGDRLRDYDQVNAHFAAALEEDRGLRRAGYSGRKGGVALAGFRL
jgi:hypothetical protein